MNKKAKIILAACSSIATMSLIVPMLTSCSNSKQFVFGNFQSYMSPSVIENINEAYGNVNWQYYSSNNEVPTYLRNKTINASVVSNNMVVKLATDYKMLEKIEWSNFKLLKSDNKTLVENSSQLNGVFNELTYKVATEGFKRFNNINLLDYCFPYFLQNFVFVYRGEQIPELSGDNVTFTDIFKVINKDSRFLTSHLNPKVWMIKDSRTVYGLSQILLDESTNNIIDINPEKGLIDQSSQESKTIDELVEDYRNLKKAITNSELKIGLNSDSNVLVNKIARNEISGAFMYNGDAIFAGLGGDYNEILNTNDFHVVVPRNTLIALDGIIINKENDKTQKEESIKLAYDLTTLGASVQEFNDWNKPINLTLEETKKLLNPQEMNMLQTTQNDEGESSYSFLVTKNFDYVNYTPTLKKLYNEVTGDKGIDYFFKNICSIRGIENNLDPSGEIRKLAELLAKVLVIKTPENISNVLEMPLNKLTDSNMQVAFTVLVNEIPG